MFLLYLLEEKLEWLEEKTKPLFVGMALLLYALSLVRLMGEIDPATNLEAFLVGALSNLSIPFGIILLQELLELVANISYSTLRSARRQFEIAMLVIIRSFFKNFAKVNAKVESGVFGEPVQEAVIKVIAIVVIVALIMTFKRLSESKQMTVYAEEGHQFNLWKQLMVVVLVVLILLDLLLAGQSFDELVFIRLVFTGLIVIDAIFLLIAILKDSHFDSLAFESGLVIGLIFARFPLFTSNMLSYTLSVVGVGFATASLYLLYLSRKSEADMSEGVAP
jgi:hypothetical protein